MPYKLETYPWKKQGGIAVCRTRADFDEAYQRKVRDPTLPYDELEYRCRLGNVMATAKWDPLQKKWV